MGTVVLANSDCWYVNRTIGKRFSPEPIYSIVPDLEVLHDISLASQMARIMRDEFVLSPRKNWFPPKRELCQTLHMSRYTLSVAACTVNEPVQVSCSRHDFPI